MLKSLFRLILGARPSRTGAVRVRGCRHRVTVRRDRHGVAYVEAETDDDAFFGLGFCQAQDRAFQLELFLRVARGKVSELVGAEMLDADRLARRIGFAQIAEAQFAACDERTQAQFDAFARGVNAGLERELWRKSHEFALLGVEPSRFAPEDPLAVLQFFSFGLSSNWDAELSRLRVLRADGKEALLKLEAAPRGFRAELDGSDRALSDVKLLEAAEAFAAGVAGLRVHAPLAGASNNWAIAGARTQSGRPLLASDPHLSPSLPAPWYLVHVATPEWKLSGACLASQPMVSIGHSEHGAWAVTAGHADNTNLFVERLGPNETVLDGGRYVACPARTERIVVKGSADVVERVLVTPRGPIVGPAMGEHEDALSLRGTWMAARAVGGYQIHLARDVEEMRACFASYPALSENRLFADVKGSIAWQMTGDVPVRRHGSGLLPAPGWEPTANWETEPLPFARMPRMRDPVRGWLASANQRPETADAPGAPYLGVDWLDGYRYARIAELLTRRDDWTVAACLAMQLDRQSRLWPEVRQALSSAAAEGDGADLAVAREVLEPWDGEVGADSAAASVFELVLAGVARRVARAAAPHAWQAALGTPLNEVLPHGTMPLRRLSHLSRLIREQPPGFFPGGFGSELRAAMVDAVRELRSRHGDDRRDWAWGRVRPLVLRHPFAAKAPFDRIFALPSVAVGGDATTIPQASIDLLDPLGDPIGIANLRAVIDVGAWGNGRWSLAGGQSGNPCSAHFGDLLPVWERGDGIAIQWSREDVVANAVSTTLLLPRVSP